MRGKANPFRGCFSCFDVCYVLCLQCICQGTSYECIPEDYLYSCFNLLVGEYFCFKDMPFISRLSDSGDDFLAPFKLGV